MSVHKPDSFHLREVFILCFNKKIYAAGAHLMISNSHDEYAISEQMSLEWFIVSERIGLSFRAGSVVEEKKVLVGPEWEALSKKESCQSQKELTRLPRMTKTSISKRFNFMGTFQSKEIECCTSSDQNMINGACLLWTVASKVKVEEISTLPFY